MQIAARPLRSFTTGLLAVAVTFLVILSSQTVFAQGTGYPDTLSFFKNYFITGDYAVAGIGVRGTGDATGWATANINMTGVPDGAVVVAAFLYWETIEGTTNPSTSNAYFQGYPIIGKPIGVGTPPCWSSGGGTGASNGSKSLRVYRADVRPYMVINGQYQNNGSFQIRLQDSGSNGSGVPLTEGASLVVVYRTLSAPLKAVVIYDGSWTINNSTSYMSQVIKGFYQADGSTPSGGKLTHIVGDGQANFTEQVYFNNSGIATNPFTGTAGYSWDNVTFNVSVPDNASEVSTTVLPVSSNFDCLSWGAVLFSTPVKDGDKDGLLDIWEDNQGYADAKDGSWVALPGANKNEKDIYVQIDYLRNTGQTSAAKHSHLPRQEALKMVGDAFANRGIHVHFDVGTKYQNAPYVILNGTGGAAIDEDQISCNDTSTSLCQFPMSSFGIPGVVSWKGGVNALKNQYFQHGRKDSYRYMVAGHALGQAKTTWSFAAGTLASITCCTPSGTQQVATVTTTSPHGLSLPSRVTIGGTIGDFHLNGTYAVSSILSTTQFTINTVNVASGTYGLFPGQALGLVNGQSNEPNLAVFSGGPRSTSGFSDLGGGDSIISLGLWRADDLSGCVADPTVALTGTQVYCNDQVGSTLIQAGTVMHELGHTLVLTHGGYYSASGGPPYTFGINCKPNFQSVMNYVFQTRGLPQGSGFAVDYSGQTLPTLDEGGLLEASGLGVDVGNGGLPPYGTRFYGPPNFLDTVVQGSAGGRYAKSHCDGTPLNGDAPTVRIDAPTVSPTTGLLAGIDWNNNGVFTDIVKNQDVNFNGAFSDSNMRGYDDWATLNLSQIGARRNVAGYSVDISGSDALGGGSDALGGGSDALGGGSDALGGGSDALGGGSDALGGGLELDFDRVNSTVDAPGSLTATVGTKSVILNWTGPAFGLIRTYYIWRADVSKGPISSTNQPKKIGQVAGTPPKTTFTDTTVKTNATYVYFVTAALGADSGPNAGNQSGPSNLLTIVVK